MRAAGRPLFAGRARGAWASLATIAVIAAGLVVPTSAAVAAEGDPEYLTVSKSVPVELQCSLPAFPDDRLLLIPGGAVRELSAAGGYTATYESLPVDAVCEIVETDAGTAVRTAITVATSTDAAQTTDGTRASIDLTDAVAATEVQVTNEFVKDLPRTGFAGGPWVWSAMLLLLGGGALLLVRSVRRRGGALTQ